MKKIILLFTVIASTLLLQSCFCCAYDYYDHGYGYHKSYYSAPAHRHGGPHAAPHHHRY